ncbi:MAG: hypothetical protein BGN96_09970 [Bacteroidales bacterium 45-6]|nr:MAG: hypothetical protein BGN96_09970 [Bacteroidales bacterium 45-6]
MLILCFFNLDIFQKIVSPHHRTAETLAKNVGRCCLETVVDESDCTFFKTSIGWFAKGTLERTSDKIKSLYSSKENAVPLLTDKSALRKAIPLPVFAEKTSWADMMTFENEMALMGISLMPFF